jgi:hypothetical protein
VHALREFDKKASEWIRAEEKRDANAARDAARAASAAVASAYKEEIDAYQRQLQEESIRLNERIAAENRR